MPVSTKGEYVRVGIEAPADCTIYREEIAPDPEPAAA
jgi:sRNA-binding carbon storage regulator CsrA